MRVKQGMEDQYNQYKETNSKDGYSARVVSYGEDWANLMEAQIEKGALVKDIAEATSHEADTDGITGFMYGYAVNALSHFWENGEALRRWHNKEWGAPESDGVVNPAVIKIG